MKNTQLLAYVAVVVAMLSISSSPFFVRWADVPGVVSGFYRQAFGLLALGPLLAARQANPSRRNTDASEQSAGQRSTIWIVVLAGLFFAADLAAWNTSLLHTSVTNATLLANTSPIYVGLGAFLLFKERLGGPFWFGLAAAMVGAALIIGADLSRASGLGIWDGLALLAGLSFGAYQLAISRARLRGMGALASSMLANAAGGMALLVLSVLLGHALVGFSLNQWLALIGMGAIAQGLGYLTMNYALGKLPAPIVSVSMLGQPVMVAIFSFPLLGEAVTTIQIIGGFSTLMGIYLVNRSRPLATGKPARPSP